MTLTDIYTESEKINKVHFVFAKMVTDRIYVHRDGVLIMIIYTC